MKQKIVIVMIIFAIVIIFMFLNYTMVIGYAPLVEEADFRFLKTFGLILFPFFLLAIIVFISKRRAEYMQKLEYTPRILKDLDKLISVIKHLRFYKFYDYKEEET